MYCIWALLVKKKSEPLFWTALCILEWLMLCLHGHVMSFRQALPHLLRRVRVCLALRDAYSRILFKVALYEWVAKNQMVLLPHPCGLALLFVAPVAYLYHCDDVEWCLPCSAHHRAARSWRPLYRHSGIIINHQLMPLPYQWYFCFSLREMCCLVLTYM